MFLRIPLFLGGKFSKIPSRALVAKDNLQLQDVLSTGGFVGYATQLPVQCAMGQLHRCVGEQRLQLLMTQHAWQAPDSMSSRALCKATGAEEIRGCACLVLKTAWGARDGFPRNSFNFDVCFCGGLIEIPKG